ncbi:MAG TPA: hypothetical protein VF283_17175 [Bryobacteraceae bacterium]
MKEIATLAAAFHQKTALLRIFLRSRLLTVLKNDHRAIFQAAAHAQRAVDYLHSLQPKQSKAAA